ncbi:MAG: hypothetical protein V1914_05030 [archaeon]
MQKKGQVTIFIILGILIALILILLTLYNQQIILSEWQKSKAEAGAELPAEQKVIQELQNCIDEKTEEAVVIAGMQGGYITLPEDPISLGPNNQFSNALTVAGSLRVPYWFYETANGLQKTQIPNVVIVQQQLGEYVKKEISSCAPETALRYNLVASEDKITVETTIQDYRTTFNINYPVTLESDTMRFTVGKIVSIVEAPLGKLMSDGSKLLFDDETFIEDRTIDMLVLYDELPYTGTEFECSTKLWTKSKVKEDFKKILAENIPQMRLKSTRNEAQEAYFNWDAINSKNINANFLFFTSWPVEMDISPSEGELLKGDEINQEIGSEAAAFMNSLFCLTNYHFVYNIKYPVLVTLSDPDTGYTLQYATQIIIKNNQPKESKIEIPDLTFESEICGDKAAQATVYTLRILPDGTLNSESDVEIKYKCANAVCNIGKTDANGQLTAMFPECYNGFVIASKNGLSTEKEIFSTNQESEISLLIDPFYTIPFEIKVIDGAERSLREDEQAIITLTEQEKEYITSITQEQTTVKLVSGAYKLQTHLMQGGAFAIEFPKQEIEHCSEVPLPILGVLGFSRTQCTKTEIPASKLLQVIKGGATTEWKITRSKLSTANKITFYIPSQGIPASNEELTEIYNKIKTATAPQPSVE